MISRRRVLTAAVAGAGMSALGPSLTGMTANAATATATEIITKAIPGRAERTLSQVTLCVPKNAILPTV